MTTHVLAANTNVSAMSLVDGDTIDCNGFKLSIDVQPSAILVTVQSPGKAGTVEFIGAGVTANLPTWTFATGSTTMIGTIPVGVIVGTVVAGSINGRNGVTINNGTVINAFGGSGAAFNAFGVSTNNGVITNSNGVSGPGCSINHGTVQNATAGSGTALARGVVTNNGTVSLATGGAIADACGVGANNGVVLSAVGGSAAGTFGVFYSPGMTLRSADNVGRGVGDWNGSTKFVIGPEFTGAIVLGSLSLSPLATLYSLGTISPLATVPPSVTIITLRVDAGETAEVAFLRALAASILAVIG